MANNNSNNNSTTVIINGSSGIIANSSVISTSTNIFVNGNGQATIGTKSRTTSSKKNVSENSRMMRSRNLSKYFLIVKISKEFEYIFKKNKSITDFEFKLYLNNLYNLIVLLKIYNESSSELIGKEVKVKQGKFKLKKFLNNKLQSCLINYKYKSIDEKRVDKLINKIKQFL